jgi:hypothetical protein
MPRSAFLVFTYQKRFLPLPLIAAAVVFGCSDPIASDEALSLRPTPIIVIDGKLLRVFNVELHSIDDPDLRPQGNLHLKLYENADGTFTLAWKGEIQNAAGESFSGFSMSQVGIDRPAFLVAFGEVEGTTPRLVEPDDSGLISAELAGSLLEQEPDDSGRVGIPPNVGDFVITFYTVERPGGALTGTV